MSNAISTGSAGEAIVFLIGFHVDQAAFCSFCRRHLFDMLDAPLPLYTFLLGSPDETERDAVRTMFGEWPRHFVRAEDLRDTLADMATSGVSDVSIVVVADRPSRLDAAELFAPLRKELVNRASGQTRFWLIAAFMSGPGFEEASIAGMLAGSTPLFQTIFLLGHDVGLPGFELNAGHFTALRLIVDLARGRQVSPDEASTRQRLRPAQHGRQPRLLWLADRQPPIENRSDDVLGYVNGAFEFLNKGVQGTFTVLNRGDQYEKQVSEFKTFCQARMEDIKPDTNQFTKVDPSASRRAGLSDGDGARESTWEEIQNFAEAVRGEVVLSYAEALKDVRSFIRDRDAARVKSLAEIVRQVDAAVLPDGGFSLQSRHAVSEEIDRIQRICVDWETEARKTRMEGSRHHAGPQRQPKTTGRGRVEFSAIPDAHRFEKGVRLAKASALDLPHRLMTLVALALGPVAMIACSFLVEAATRPGGREFLVNLLKTERGVGPLVAVTGLPALIVLLSNLYHRRRQRVAFATVRSLSDDMHALVTEAMDETKAYAIRTRSALLGREFARLLRKRMDDEPRSHLSSEATRFFHSHRALALAPAEQDEVRKITGRSPPHRWVRQFIADRLLHSSGRGFWELEIRVGDNAGGVAFDKDAAVETAILAASDWLSAPVKVRLSPLAWPREADLAEPPSSQDVSRTPPHRPSSPPQ